MLLALKITGIGLLPIFMVLACFVFLWTLVVYNSLKNRRTTIENQVQTIGKLVFQRIQSLTRFQELLKTNLLTDTEGYTEQRLTQETEQLNDHIQTLGLENDPQVQQLRDELAQNAARIVKTQRRVRSLRSNYNELCTHMPYRLVANVFGFKQISL